jgi:hypothetical protein
LKRIIITLTIILMLTACAPAAPALTPTALPPTVTSTAEPTLTPEPTEVPIPEGWTEIAETQEIGGRQVVINEQGEAATEIDGEWYSVDVKGCYYPELFDPALQENDPQIMELLQWINVEPSLERDGKKPIPRHYWSRWMGFEVSGRQYPAYNEETGDGLLLDQQLCFNQVTQKWTHMIKAIVPTDRSIMPNESAVIRVVVGWVQPDGNYTTFTYLEPSKVVEGVLRQDYGSAAVKADSLQAAVRLWQPFVESHEQVVLGSPMSIAVSENDSPDPSQLGSLLRKIVREAGKNDPGNWREETLNDPEFLEWAPDQGGQVHHLSNRSNQRELYIDHHDRVRRWWGEQAAGGMMPEMVVRVVKVNSVK